MLSLFIVLANGIVIKCVGGSCDTMSTAAFTVMATEGAIELIFTIKGMIKIFREKGKSKKK